MTNALTFADAIGRRALASAAQVGLTAVSNAVVRGRFPAHWYLVAKALADERGVECPPSLFGMIDAETLPAGSDANNLADAPSADGLAQGGAA